MERTAETQWQRQRYRMQHHRAAAKFFGRFDGND
jgi:hypothetical protein